jgi:hypothetical protein
MLTLKSGGGLKSEAEELTNIPEEIYMELQRLDKK